MYMTSIGTDLNYVRVIKCSQRRVASIIEELFHIECICVLRV
jgi:hypothetical protein